MHAWDVLTMGWAITGFRVWKLLLYDLPWLPWWVCYILFSFGYQSFLAFNISLQSILVFLWTETIIISGSFILCFKLLPSFSLNTQILHIFLPSSRPRLTKWRLSSPAGFPGRPLSHSFLIYPWLSTTWEFILNVHLLSVNPNLHSKPQVCLDFLWPV